MSDYECSTVYRRPPLFRTPCDRRDCPDPRGVLISEVKVVQYTWQSMENHLIPVTYVYIKGVGAVQGAGLEGCGLEGCLQFRVWNRRGGGGVHFRVWIRGVCTVQGAGLEGCVQFRVWNRGVGQFRVWNRGGGGGGCSSGSGLEGCVQFRGLN